jgi:hypothetical protein
MLSSGASIISRWVTLPVTIAAWLLLSNHCALAILAASADSAPEMSACPMHSSPAKKNPGAKTPCCKTLHAIVAKSVAANPAALRLIGPLDYTKEIFARPVRIAIEIHGLDTGPPGYLSFAESVLQESMLSHAPPLS